MIFWLKSRWEARKAKRDFQSKCSNFYIKTLLNLEHQIMADLTELKQMVAANTEVIESAIILLNGLKEKLGSCTSQAEIDDLKASLEAETAKLAEAVAMNTPQP